MTLAQTLFETSEQGKHVGETRQRQSVSSGPDRISIR